MAKPKAAGRKWQESNSLCPQNHEKLWSLTIAFEPPGPVLPTRIFCLLYAP